MAKKNSREYVKKAVEKVKARVKNGESVQAASKAEGINFTSYYNHLKKENGGKKVSKKAQKRTYNRKPKAEPEISFKELDVNPNRTMIIVTNDSETVANILIAAFGRGA